MDTAQYCKSLLSNIQFSKDWIVIADSISRYSEKCEVTNTAIGVISDLLTSSTEPQVVAECIKFLRVYSPKDGDLIAAVIRHLNYASYVSDWYDATIASVGYFRRFASSEDKQYLQGFYDLLISDAIKNNDMDFVEFCEKS